MDGIIYKASHFFQVTELSDKLRDLARMYIKNKLIQMDLVKDPVTRYWTKVPGRQFVLGTPDKSSLFFHINCYDDFIQYIGNTGIKEDHLTIQEIGFEDWDIAPANLTIHSHLVPYDYQEEMIAYTLEPGARKVVSLPPGEGKGLIAMTVAVKLNQRACMLLLPRYKDKWVKELKETYVDIEDKLLVLDDVPKLIRYLDKLRAGLEDSNEVQFIVLTTTTLKLYQKLWWERGCKGDVTMVNPIDIWRVMRIGYRVTDEVHEHFHNNFLIDLQTHIPKTLYLSATLDPSNEFLKRMYRIMFPIKERMGTDRIKKYIDVYPIRYRHLNILNWRYMRDGMYSHVMYENNYIGDKPNKKRRRESYFKLICKLLDTHFFEVRKPGQKAIVFFAQVEMCNYFRDYVKQVYPNEDIRRYVFEDDYTELMEGTLLISTPGSAGTAVDIRGLITNIMTLSIRSIQQNLQIMGRTRELKQHPGQHPRFVYLVAEDMERSEFYHQEKLKLLADRTHSITEVDMGWTIPA